MFLNILPDGTIESLYTDEIDLQEIGNLSVKRASHVEFNSDKQAWFVTIVDTGEVFGPHKTRKAALKEEVEVLESRMESNPGYSIGVT